MLVAGRIATDSLAQRPDFVGRKAQVLGTQREHRALDHQTRHRQRRRFARGYHDLASLGQVADQRVDGIDHVFCFADDVEIVQHQDEARRRLTQVLEQQARQADTIGAFSEPASQLWHRTCFAEAGVQRIGQSREQAPGVTIGRLQREPRDSRAAIARVRRCESALAEPGGCNEQDERTRAVLVQHLEQSLASQLVRRRGRDARRSQFHFVWEQYGAARPCLAGVQS